MREVSSLDSTPIIEMENISKSFSGNQVLNTVNFDVRRGEIHALMGENGAGKSTLVKILTGIHARDNGTIKVNESEVNFTNPKQAEEKGIVVIHQELNIIPYLTVAQNIFLGKEITYGKTGILNTNKMNKLAAESLSALGVSNIRPQDLAGDLSVGKQQMVEIARALSTHAELIIMDEPTSALTDREIENLFKAIDSLKKKGVAFVYISHRMEEIFQICDRITILRDGNYIGTENIPETNFESIVKMMVGRELGGRFPEKNNSIGDVVFQVESLTVKGLFEDIHFEVRKGEILGVSGLMGAGRTELMETIFGHRKKDEGTVKLNGKPIKTNHPGSLIKEGIGFITEDRKGQGLILDFPIRENISLTNFGGISRLGVIEAKQERKLADKLIQRLHVKTSNREQTTGTLSGGNQQKVVIAKWLGTNPQVLILDEPTRGVDIGAKKEIYSIMNQLAEDGVAIIMISSELPEILGVSDRVMVMHEGKVKAFFEKHEATQEKIMMAATGGE
ncbi:sugar ABC transporter ATP-binding protein [Oceanobacillus sp. FSL H7-0719]|uniref:sugar ABC transporter ATP-binding protein n=1 Tax=Oceanobacillus sp. FSL H7-0719 TaxID=2954507 RepID=UPI00324E3453